MSKKRWSGVFVLDTCLIRSKGPLEAEKGQVPPPQGLTEEEGHHPSQGQVGAKGDLLPSKEEPKGRPQEDGEKKRQKA